MSKVIIRKTKGFEKEFGKYIVNDGNTSDVTWSLVRAIRYWLWHKGVSPKIAFFNLKKKI